MANSNSKHFACNRRSFIRRTAAAALGAPFALGGLSALAEQAIISAEARSRAKVAIARCSGYGPEVRPALKSCFDQVGGVDKLVRNKTVTVKINLTGTNFEQFLGKSTGETFMTHSSTAMALTSLLFDYGAQRVRFVESTTRTEELSDTLVSAGWDVRAFDPLGKVEFENTRNLGHGKSYAHLKVPSGGYMFTAFDFNHSYSDTDVMISLAKLKRHITTGVTLSMKNMFGITPNSIYGSEAGSESATGGRMPVHYAKGYEKVILPNQVADHGFADPFTRIPHTVVDVCGARPIDLAIIDGISAMTGAEGPWCANAVTIKATTPGVMIVGLNPVSTDAVATAVMGYDPRAPKGTHPFEHCDSIAMLAEKAGLGTADLSQIDVRGLTVEKARYQYD